MGVYTADVSRNMFDETKRYQQLVSQQGKPWVAADDNDGQQIVFNLLRRFIQLYWGDGSPDDGFKIVGNGTDNDFIITGGDGTIEGAGRMNLGGFQCFLPGNRNYAATDNLECAPVSTALSGVMLTDSAANFTLGGADDNLVGRTLIPDITQPIYSYAIIANTHTTVTVTGPIDINQTVVGSHYRVDLSTPVGSNRTDEVYLDCYLDEISGDEDPDIKHTLAIQIETCRRLKLIQNVLVAEGGITPAAYIDVDGNQHYTMKLAILERFDGQTAINPGDLTDTRVLTSPIILDFTNAQHGHRNVAEGEVIFPAGTKMVFYQAAAPTGWTQDTSHNDKILRVVSGVGGGSGGNASPLSHYHTQPAHTHAGGSHTHTTGDHTLTIAEMPAHTHMTGTQDWQDWGTGSAFNHMDYNANTVVSSSAGGGAAHNHGSTGSNSGTTGSAGGENTSAWTPYYIDLIIAVRD